MSDSQSRRRGPAGPVVTKGLRWWLRIVLVVFGLLALDSIYLAAVDLTAWWTGEPREDQAYLWAILAHLVLGLAIIVPYIIYGARHAWRARRTTLALRAVGRSLRRGGRSVGRYVGRWVGRSVGWSVGRSVGR